MQNILSEARGDKDFTPVVKGAAKPKLKKIQSRFGEIEVSPDSGIFFKHGLLGIPSAVTFFLTKLPGSKDDQFMLLQCEEDNDLSFIVVPSQYDNQLIEKKDLDDACKVLSYDTKSLLVLFIVTVHVEGKQRNISVNAKAPVLIDANSKTASQYVLQSGDYKIQHMIS